MSAPQGPRARSNSRGRGTSRGGVWSRDPRSNGTTGGDGPAGRRRAYNATRGSDSRHLKPSPHQGHQHKSSREKPRPHGPLTSAIQSHAGKIPDPRLESWRNPATVDNRTYKQRMLDLYQTLKENRERERKDAIKDGFLADPDKPTSLANAITPVGTCQEMCPEFERVERIVQFMVDNTEKMPSTLDLDTKVPCEQIMVKRFRRSAAGYDEQLPSDIRPPVVLQKTLDYLFNDVVGGPEPLAAVHKFVWDRTRGIRNDFSIQQVTRTEDLKIAIDCFERIARFHILSLHQLSQLDSENGEFDAHQEREQLNNTLLSLMYYYDDSRHKLTSPKEAEFRAYCIVFEIQDLRPDLEDRAQSWPRAILKDARVQAAFKLYAAAGNTADDQGPLRPKTRFLSAQGNTRGFWNLVRSNAVSYLMACVAEIYFNLVRRTALEAIWKAYKGKRGGPTKMEDWTLRDLTPALGFDTEEQTEIFCREHEFDIGETENGEPFLDLGSVMNRSLTDQNPRRKQIWSQSLVEEKRLGRTLPAVINGLSASQAQAQGLVNDSSDAETASVANSESLFVDGTSDDEGRPSHSRSVSPQKKPVANGDAPKLNPTATPFNPFAPSPFGNSSKSNPFQGATTFGLPSTTPSSSPFQPALTSNFESSSKPTSSSPFGEAGGQVLPKFDFLAAANKAQDQGVKDAASSSSSNEPPKFNFFPSPAKAEGTKDSEKDSPSSHSVRGQKTTFGQPSTALSTTKPTEPAKTLPAPATSRAPTASSEPKSVFDEPSNSWAPGKVSFATSPLFDLGAKTSSKDDRQIPSLTLSQDSKKDAPDTTSSQRNNVKVKPSFFTTPSTATEKTTPTFLTPSAKPLASAESPPKDTSKPFSFFSTVNTNPTLSAPTSQSLPISTSSKPSTSSIFPETKRVDASTEPTFDTILLKPPSFYSTTPSPPQAQLEPSQTLSSNVSTLSGSTAVESTSTQPRQYPFASTRPRLDPRSAALDKLSNAVMLEDNGLLQQFIEHTVGPIVTSSVAQLKDEWSWEEARECRAILLSKKYLKKWRTNAWNICLLRQGRERRRNFAMSIQQSARNSPQRQIGFSASLAAEGHANLLLRQESQTKVIPPPSEPPHKRQSLPADFGPEKLQSEAAAGTKRKRDDAIQSAIEILPRPTKVSHRRTQTLGNSISAPPYRISRPVRRSRLDVSKVPEASLIHETLMKQARRLAPNAKSDTTRTDYFRLKALGIDPDTPVVPLTRKRTRDEVRTNGATKAVKSSPQTPASKLATKPSMAQSSTHTPHTPSQSTSDQDEALFASLRSVRQALAESEQWMQTERQSIERQSGQRTATPQTSASPPITETPAQRRLREIKERGHTPSRTEVRLRAMGDKALLPKGFWDGDGMGTSLYGKGKGKEDSSTPTPMRGPSVQCSQPMGPPMMGFAALGAGGLMNGQLGIQGQMNGQLGAPVMSGARQDDNQQKSGTSVEDAIEL